MMSEHKVLELRYSHNVIEHLGLKLYQNRPTNVLAELVSNSWDADATNVWLDIGADHLAVYDDGEGMTREVLSDNYLVIGKRKRTADNVEELTEKGRRMMGRKGIGKLAPFGIAQKLSLLTVSRETQLCYWIEIDLQGLLSESSENSEELFSYKPDVICDGVSIDQIPLSKDAHGYVKHFLEVIDGGGTLVVMDNLSLRRALPKNNLRESIGQRFTVTLLREDFNVYVDNELVTEEQALPNFYLRIPETGFEEETINCNGIERSVRYWVGFVKEAEWPQDQAGVGVYAHGKIAQDRPFVFGLKGREISTRYMYGVIEADWLDELDEDVVSTDRTSVNWENDYTEQMYLWGQKLVGQWIQKYRKFQKGKTEEEVTEKLNTIPNLPKITPEERSAIKDMVCGMSSKVYRDGDLQTEVITQLTSAWTHRPTRSIIKSLWDRLQHEQLNESEFISTLGDIHKHLVPESLSLSVNVAQKIYALTQLNRLSVNGTERQLQSLLESFPWILGAERGKVTANQQLKTLAREATLAGNVPNHGYTKEELERLADTPDATTRPDFCYFSDENKANIVVVELKSPTIPLEYEHLMQLLSYYYWLKKVYPQATIKGYLIGQNAGNAIESENPNIEVLTWERVCIQSRKDYLDMLATMLNGVSEHYDDVRVRDVFEFGGEETRELLKRMADVHSPLNDFFEVNDKQLEKK
ncbi:ATP-binding protein [Vibrio harveyi]|uniref:ATP-binding protein n=1 Tax=Vibrio harveyi TaxID=669 RepID=UPI0028C2987D|nr:ATP-binding protein [Vibrio harveyi]